MICTARVGAALAYGFVGAVVISGSVLKSGVVSSVNAAAAAIAEDSRIIR